MARSSQPSKSSSHKNYAKRGRDSSRTGKSQSRSASSRSQSRTRSSGNRAGSKDKPTSNVRARSRPTIQAPRGRSATQPRKAAAGQASATRSRTVSRPTSRPVSTKRRRANDDSKPVKPKRKMSAYNVFVREQLTGSPDVSLCSTHLLAT